MSHAAPTASRPSALPGQVDVEDYTGQPAEQAGWLVRRLGLRPGMCQSFGCEPALHGHVVAQHPAAGESASRGTIVELHIGVAEQPPSDPESQQADEAPQEPAAADADPQPAEPPRRRSRKSGRERAPAAIDTPPPPASVHAPTPPQRRGPLSVEQPPAGQQAEDMLALARDHGDISDISYREVLAASELFSGQTEIHALRLEEGATRRPSSARERAASWARSHPALAITLTLALCIWVAVAATRPATHSPAREQTRPLQRTSAGNSRQAHPHPTSRPRKRARPTVPRRRERAEIPRRSVAPSAPAELETNAAPAQTATAQRPAPPPASSGGGPFSP